MHTPDFPLWAGGFSALFGRLRRANGATLHQLEALFGPWIGSFRLAPREEKAFSRQRCWTLRLVFWTFLWQVAQAGSSCREAIRQAQCLCQRLGHKTPPDENSPYCTARAKLPLEQLDEIHRAVVADTEKAVASKQLWCGRTVRVIDATTVLAADTPQNQAAFPQHPSQKPGCGFPILRLIGLFSLATGLFLAWSTGSWNTSELAMLQSLWEHLRPNQVLLGDRVFGNWVTLAQCLYHRVDGVFRLRGHRRSDWRRGKRLSKDQRLVQWSKPAQRPPLSQSEPMGRFARDFDAASGARRCRPAGLAHPQAHCGNYSFGCSTLPTQRLGPTLSTTLEHGTVSSKPQDDTSNGAAFLQNPQ